MIAQRAFLSQSFAVAPEPQIRRAVLDHLASQSAPRLILHINLHSLFLKAKDPELAAILDGAATLPLFEGIALKLASGLRYGAVWPDISGTDLVPAVLAELPKDTRLALIGARPEILDAAAAEIAARFGQVQITCAIDGYDGIADRAALAQRLAAAQPDLVLIALGSPLQEHLAAELRGCCEARLFWAVGGLFDFLSGAKPRAPLWCRKARLEWAWRLAHEPQRLWQRTMIEGPWLIQRVLADLISRPRKGAR